MNTNRYIEYLTIKGFKSIRNLNNFKMDKLNVLIGSNGAGKSNFISYFRMLGEMVSGRLQSWTSNQGSADRIVSFGVKETKQLESIIRFGCNGYSFILEPTIDGGFSFSNEEVYFHNQIYPQPYNESLGSGHKEANIKNVSSQVVNYCYNAIVDWRVFHFHDTSDSAYVKRNGALHDNIYLRPDASNLAAFLYKMKVENPNIYNQIRKTVSLAIPFFDDFELKPQMLSSGEEMITLLWKQKNSDYAFWPSQLSDGSIRFICLVTALLQPNPLSTIIIDEPELGLHPYAITLLASLLRSASQRMQVVVSTQSIPLVNEFSISDLIIVERENDATVFKRYNDDDYAVWLEDYSVGELWEKNILGGRPHK